MRKFILNYDSRPYWKFDEFALNACQKENYGSANNWFYTFRGGLNGFHARMEGAKRHYRDIHEWMPLPRIPKDTEYHLASFFFNVDSSIECMVFALNAIGYATKGKGYRNINDPKELRKVSPYDVAGNRTGVKPMSGYKDTFPRTQELWRINSELMELIFEQHDVSKHRHTIFEGGSMRNDAPEGFWEYVNVPESERSLFMPMKEIILGNDLKLPIEDRLPQKVEEFIYLEDIAEEFFEFVSILGYKILKDISENIPIKVYKEYYK